MSHIYNLTIIKKLIATCFVVIIAFIAASPVSVAASTFKPNTQDELIAYMFGIIDTLQAQIDAKSGTASSRGSSRVSSSITNLAVEARVTLRAEFSATNNRIVYAWFEYGEGSKLTTKTTRTKATGTGTSRTHARTLTGLKSCVAYSYRPVFQISNGTKYYGAVRTFSTGCVSASLSPVGETTSGRDTGFSVSTSNRSMSFDKNTYKSHDSIELAWTVPSSRRSNENWIGIFEVRDNNHEYQSWRYLRDATRGTVTFTAPGEGTYEFRLFYDNSYDDVLTSRKFTVVN